MKAIYIFGGGGHSKVIIEIAKLNGYTIKGIIAEEISKELQEYPSLSHQDFLKIKGAKEVCIAIGNNQVREKIYESLKSPTLSFPTLIHPKAIVSASVVIGEGSVVMAGAVINPYTKIGIGGIINTGAVIDHDCCINDFSHIAPNTSLAGSVHIGNKSFIGIGSSVINNIHIGDSITVGAGSVVVNDLIEERVYKGNPAK